MIPIIEDDIFFHKAYDIRDFRFEIHKDANLFFVYWGDVAPTTDSKIGELYFHKDYEMIEAYIEDDLDYNFEDIHFVYINNDVVYLKDLRIYREWE